MKWQVDQTTSWQRVDEKHNMTKWRHWWNKLTKQPSLFKLPCCQIVVLPSCHFVYWLFCLLALSSTSCQLNILSTGFFVNSMFQLLHYCNLTFGQLAILSNCCFIYSLIVILTFCQLAVLPSWCFNHFIIVNLTFLSQIDISPTH